MHLKHSHGDVESASGYMKMELRGAAQGRATKVTMLRVSGNVGQGIQGREANQNQLIRRSFSI